MYCHEIPIFIINLKKDRQKKEHMQKLCIKNNLHTDFTEAVYGNKLIVKNQRITEREYTKPTVNVVSYDKLLVTNFIPINTLTYRATLVNGIEGFDETLASLEDWEFFLCLARLTSFLHIDQDTVKSGYSQRVWWLFKQNTDKGLNLFFDFIKSGLQYFFLLSRYTCFKFFVKCFVRLRYES